MDLSPVLIYQFAHGFEFENDLLIAGCLSNSRLVFMGGIVTKVRAAWNLGLRGTREKKPRQESLFRVFSVFRGYPQVFSVEVLPRCGSSRLFG